MIALDIDMPESCISCPCFQTISAIGAFQDEKWFVRQCAANHRVMNQWLWKYNVPMPQPKGWDDFSKPDWCPWIEMEEK